MLPYDITSPSDGWKQRKHLSLQKQRPKQRLWSKERIAKRCPQPHTKRSSHHPPSDSPRHCWRQPHICSEEWTQEKQTWPLCHHPVPPDYQVGHEKDRKQQCTVFMADVKANKHQTKQVVKKLCGINMSQVITLIRPDREKKAYV